MKRVLILTCLLVTISVALYAQLSETQQKAITVKRLIELKHVSPRPVDDSFSIAVFNSLIDVADPRHFYFTDAEYQKLKIYRLKLDDELNGNGWAFLDLFAVIYRESLLRSDSIIKRITQNPFNFTTNEYLNSTKIRNYSFSPDRVTMSSRWTRYFKYMILGQAYNLVENDSSNKLSLDAALKSSEVSLRERIRKTELRAIKNILSHSSGFETIVTDLYLNAIAMTFDPHSNYFPPAEKEQFQASLSTEQLSFGIDLTENEKGGIIIARLIPGGPAWKSGELNKGDELQQLQGDDNKPMNTVGVEIQDVYDMLDIQGKKPMAFRFRKTDGTIKELVLRKAKVDNEENIVKSFVLTGEKRIGYIILPGFYTEWENESGSSCANDVAKEIVKLKKEKVDGLILDLRFNGGGSVGEALEMTGLFINEGPLAGAKDRTGKLRYYKDPNRGTIYDGPLAVLVNGQSASASEMLAASLQDYNRAVIIGSNTFGKGTSQTIFPLDTITRNLSMNNKKDVVKITGSKLYRLNGHTSQMNGVAVDIQLPDAFDGLESGERFEKNALSPDEVGVNQLYKPLTALPLKELSLQSKVRVEQKELFQQIKKMIAAQILGNASNTITIPLKQDLFEKWIKENEIKLEIFKGEASSGSKIFKVENHSLDLSLIQSNVDAKELNQSWIRNISEDIYIEESFSVIKDLIKLSLTSQKN